MIAFLKGNLAAVTSTSAYLEVHGIGFELLMSASALSRLPELGEAVMAYTSLQVRDDAATLFGFLSLEEKALFEKLITVGGIGSKIALAALSIYTPAQLARAIADQDVASVQRIPGVGKKTASRIILELKGSLDIDGAEGLFSGDTSNTDGVALQTAADDLRAMGFSSAEIELALVQAPEDADEATLVKYALKRLGSL